MSERPIHASETLPVEINQPFRPFNSTSMIGVDLDKTRLSLDEPSANVMERGIVLKGISGTLCLSPIDPEDSDIRYKDIVTPLGSVRKVTTYTGTEESLTEVPLFLRLEMKIESIQQFLAIRDVEISVNIDGSDYSNISHDWSDGLDDLEQSLNERVSVTMVVDKFGLPGDEKTVLLLPPDENTLRSLEFQFKGKKIDYST